MFYFNQKNKKVNMERNVKHFTFEKNLRSQNFDFLGKKIWRNARNLKSKKVQGIF